MTLPGLNWLSRGGRARERRLERIRTAQEEARQAQAAPPPGLVSVQPRRQAPMEAVRSPGQGSLAERAPREAEPGGFLASLRSCCPYLSFERWFGRGPAPDIESGESIALTDRGRPKPRTASPVREPFPGPPDVAWRDQAAGTPPQSLRPGRSRTLPPRTIGDGAEATGRDGAGTEVRKRRDTLETRQEDTARPAREAVAERKAGPQPEGWTLSAMRPRRERVLSPAAARKAEEFQGYIRQGFAPATAAKLLGEGSVLKPLKSVENQFEIRLNQHDRLTFRSNPVTKEVVILEIGGHT